MTEQHRSQQLREQLLHELSTILESTTAGIAYLRGELPHPPEIATVIREVVPPEVRFADGVRVACHLYPTPDSVRPAPVAPGQPAVVSLRDTGCSKDARKDNRYSFCRRRGLIV